MEMPEQMILPDLSFADAQHLLEKLESHPDLIASHWLTLEAMIGSLMDLTFKATEAKDKMRLAALEYRARLLRKRIEHPQN